MWAKKRATVDSTQIETTTANMRWVRRHYGQQQNTLGGEQSEVNVTLTTAIHQQTESGAVVLQGTSLVHGAGTAHWHIARNSLISSRLGQSMRNGERAQRLPQLRQKTARGGHTTLIQHVQRDGTPLSKSTKPTKIFSVSGRWKQTINPGRGRTCACTAAPSDPAHSSRGSHSCTPANLHAYPCHPNPWVPTV